MVALHLRLPQWLSGYPLMVLVAGFLSQMIMEGIIQAQDVFPPYIHDYFRSTFAEACVSHSVMHGFSELMGPLSDRTTKRFGERVAVMLGAAIGTLGFLGCALSTQLVHLNVASATAGLGFGLMSVPIVTMVSFHFDKKLRYVMTTATTVGGALGAAMFPFLLNAIIDANPWQYAFTLIACITAQLLCLGTLLSRRRPHPDTDVDDGQTDVEPEVKVVSTSMTSKLVVPVFLLSSLLWHIGSYSFEVLPLRLSEENFNGDQIALVISMQATFVVVGRLMATVIIGNLRVDPVLLYNVGTLLVALSRLLIGWPNSYAIYLALVCLSGLGVGVATALVPSVVMRLTSLDRLNFVYGLELLTRGLTGIAVPIAGAHLADTQGGNFFLAFFVGGICLLAAALCLLPYHWPLSSLCGRGYKTVRTV